MGELLLWLLAATALCLLVGWLIRRQRVDANRARAAERQRFEAQAERERIVAAEVEREAQRLAALHAEKQRRAADRAAAERAAAALAEHERLAAAHAEHERAAAEQTRHEAQRLAAERARHEAQRVAAEGAQREAQRLAAEQARRQAASRAEQQRLAAERAAADRLQAQRAEARAAEAALEAQPLAEQAAMAVPPRGPKSAAQTLVLVADDSKVVRIKTGRLLAQHQYRVSQAGDGLDALQQMQAELPDVLITDVEMPGMDGFELTRHIRGNPLTAQLPVIMITAADERHREQAEAAGVSVLLGKPYAEDELLAHIRRAMGGHAEERSSAAALA